MDDFLEGELADINEMFHEFEVKDKKKEQRTQAELEEIEKLKAKSSHVVELAPPVNSLEEVAKRRSMESTTIEEQWKKEMQALEDERLQALQQQKPEIDPETDIVLQNLDNELQSLIHDKEEEVKLTQQEKVLRAEREKEERERKERERREKIANTETPEVLTVEEWITWMEEKKKQGMTPAQLEEYEHRKKVWQQKEKEREEKRRQEEEEQKRKTRQKMESEMRLYRERQIEVKESRLTEEELHLKQEEMARRNAEESRLRKERAQKFRMEEKQRELEEMRPKAKSALAAKWEESVKSRSIGKSMTRDQHRATVLTGNIKIEETQSLEREEERLIRRISGSFPNGTAKNSQKRNSVQ